MVGTGEGGSASVRGESEVEGRAGSLGWRVKEGRRGVEGLERVGLRRGLGRGSETSSSPQLFSRVVLLDVWGGGYRFSSVSFFVFARVGDQFGGGVDGAVCDTRLSALARFLQEVDAGEVCVQ